MYSHLSAWQLCLYSNCVKALKNHLTTFDVWRVDKTHASQKSRTIFTVLFQYPLHLFYSVSMIGSLVIGSRLLEAENDCCCLTWSQAGIWSRESSFIGMRDRLKNNKWGTTFSPPLLEIILFLTWVIGKDFTDAPSVSDGFAFMSKLDFLI